MSAKAAVIRIVAVALIFSGVASAESPSVETQSTSAHGKSRPDNIGLAYYAMLSPQWPCEPSLDLLKKIADVPRLSILWNTFGADSSCLTRFLEQPGPKMLQVHLINEAGQRNKRLGSYEILAGVSVREYSQGLKRRDPALRRKLEDYFRPAADLLARYRGAELSCYVSPGLESNLDPAAARELFAIVKPLFPGCEMVWNPVGSNILGRLDPGVNVYELHGSRIKLEAPCIANLDGEDIDLPGRAALMKNHLIADKLPQYIERFAHCAANFIWIAEFNALAGDRFVDPRERKNYPTPATFNSLGEAITRARHAIKSPHEAEGERP